MKQRSYIYEYMFRFYDVTVSVVPYGSGSLVTFVCADLRYFDTVICTDNLSYAEDREDPVYKEIVSIFFDVLLERVGEYSA